MKTVNQQPSLREELIEKGLELLIVEGLDNFSLRHVARACKVSHAAPYRHFKNKHELLRTIAEEGMKRFTIKLKQAVKKYPKDYKQQLVALGRCYVEFALENPNYMRVLFTKSLQSTMKTGEGPQEKGAAFEYLRNAVAQCTKLPDFRFEDEYTAVLAAWSLVHGLSVLAVEDQFSGYMTPGEVEEGLKGILKLLFNE